MKSIFTYLAFALGLAVAPFAAAHDAAKKASARSFESLQASFKPDRIVTYHEVDGRELKLHVFHPKGFTASGKYPAFVAIHGGGWKNGNPQRFYPYAGAMAEKGHVGISVEYRLVSQKGVSVFDCVKDGRAAVRYIRAHAGELGIDPRRIAVAGGSAGAHVAAGTALFDGVDHPGTDAAMSCRPDALVLFFPVIDTSEKGYGCKLIGDEWRTISPVGQVKPHAPSTLVFHGDADKVTPYAGAVLFQKRMLDAGNVCELVTHPGGNHGYIHTDIALFDDVIRRTAEFLAKNMPVSE
jgi:acetyl esterase/lipase